MTSLFNYFKHSLVNRLGAKTNRKIVVFESDDWGSLRLPEIGRYADYQKRFPDYYTNPYLRYDSLASAEDLEFLFELLASFKDKNSNAPVFTFNTVVANPDFEKIKASDYQHYFYEPFTQTLEKYSPHTSVFSVWQQAMNDKLMCPQFHGREHVNVPVWLQALQSGNQKLLDAFALGTWSVPGKATGRINLQASLDWEKEQPLSYQEAFISEGLALFKTIFGFPAQTMIPNNYILDFTAFPLLQNHGIIAMQGMKYHKLPKGDSAAASHPLVRRSWGHSTRFPLPNLVRNCQFEPSQTHDNFDDVGHCLSAVSNAFFWNKPAVIDTHRLNYVGVYDVAKRDRNLKKTALLLRQILKKWPDVEFMSSAELATLTSSL
ncbi:hypothetical protein [Flavobacterium sp.]|uniref:hypothetical protein n=1 Tax=Flavobacterium sp. TaxID=239 RepID=UPI002FDCE74E